MTPRQPRIRRAAWWSLAAVISFQAVLGAASLFGQLRQSLAAGYAERLFATSDQRLEKAVGADFEIVKVLRQIGRDMEWVLVGVAAAPSGEDAVVAAGQRLARLRILLVLLYPKPVIAAFPGDPIGTAEARLRKGQDVLLLAFDGDPTPAGRAGWTCLHEAPEFTVWRLQKD